MCVCVCLHMAMILPSSSAHASTAAYGRGASATGASPPPACRWRRGKRGSGRRCARIATGVMAACAIIAGGCLGRLLRLAALSVLVAGEPGRA